jgi:hypothetical protein
MNEYKTDFRQAYSLVRSIRRERTHLQQDNLDWLLHRLTHDYFSDEAKLRFCRILKAANLAYNAERYQAHDNYTHLNPYEIKIHDPLLPSIKHALNIWRKARGLKPVKWKSK